MEGFSYISREEGKGEKKGTLAFSYSRGKGRRKYGIVRL